VGVKARAEGVGRKANRMRIQIIYPGHAFSTIDVADGYVDALEALGHTVKPFNYHRALAFYNRTITYWYDEFAPDIAVAQDAFAVMASEHVVVDAVDFVPDVVLIVNGMALHRRAYELLHSGRTPGAGAGVAALQDGRVVSRHVVSRSCRVA
jgi:hypothetical protein